MRSKNLTIEESKNTSVHNCTDDSFPQEGQENTVWEVLRCGWHGRWMRIEGETSYVETVIGKFIRHCDRKHTSEIICPSTTLPDLAGMSYVDHCTAIPGKCQLESLITTSALNTLVWGNCTKYLHRNPIGHYDKTTNQPYAPWGCEFTRQVLRPHPVGFWSWAWCHRWSNEHPLKSRQSIVTSQHDIWQCFEAPPRFHVLLEHCIWAGSWGIFFSLFSLISTCLVEYLRSHCGA